MMVETNQLPLNNEVTPTLQSIGLTKQYSGVTVVNNVNIQVNQGMIRAVVGENGAGKSTLMKMLTGDVKPDAGTIHIDGKTVQFDNPREANLQGVAMVHQELQLIPTLSVLDNLMLVNPIDAAGIRRHSQREIDYTLQQLKKVGLNINPKTLVSLLSVAQAQLLEIAKALALNAKILIFDEPTSALPLHEVESLLLLVESLRKKGHAILYISHHLAEVLRLADAITVMRDGKVVGEFQRGEATEDDLIRLMVMRPVAYYTNAKPPIGQEIVFSADKLATEAVRGVSFELRRGEILGFAGLMGSGMQQAALALCGEAKIKSGSLELNGQKVKFRSPYDAVCAGVVIVPEDRKLDGIIPDASIDDNFHVGRLSQFISRGALNRRKMQQVSLELVQRFGVQLRALQQPIKTLSGGNQQKVVVGRCVQESPQVLILCEPTRGIDVAAKDDIHRHILKLASAGTSIILVTSELEEVLALSHRIAVFSEGEMVGILDEDQATPVNVMTLATPKRINSDGGGDNYANSRSTVQVKNGS
jgi:ABC-type sugar transport system ATPase subunit